MAPSKTTTCSDGEGEVGRGPWVTGKATDHPAGRPKLVTSAPVSPLELPTHDSPEVSIIVLGFRRADVLRRCLESLAEHRLLPPVRGRRRVERRAPRRQGLRRARGDRRRGRRPSGQRRLRGRLQPRRRRRRRPCPRPVERRRRGHPRLARRPRAPPSTPGRTAGLVGSLLLFPDGARPGRRRHRSKPTACRTPRAAGLPTDDPVATTARRRRLRDGCGAAVRRDGLGRGRAAWTRVTTPPTSRTSTSAFDSAPAGWEVWFVPDAVLRPRRVGQQRLPPEAGRLAPESGAVPRPLGARPTDGPARRRLDPRRDLVDPAVQVALLRRLAALADEHVERAARRPRAAREERGGHRTGARSRARPCHLAARAARPGARHGRQRRRPARTPLAARGLRRWRRRVPRPAVPPAPPRPTNRALEPPRERTSVTDRSGRPARSSPYRSRRTASASASPAPAPCRGRS